MPIFTWQHELIFVTNLQKNVPFAQEPSVANPPLAENPRIYRFYR